MDYASLMVLAVVAFVQNMAFTWTSRSRNSGDPAYHRYAAYSSNGVYFICQIFLVKNMWEPLMSGDYLTMLVGGAVYVAATSEGSVAMMRFLLTKEKGKRKVGSDGK